MYRENFKDFLKKLGKACAHQKKQAPPPEQKKYTQFKIPKPMKFNGKDFKYCDSSEMLTLGGLTPTLKKMINVLTPYYLRIPIKKI